MILRQPRAWPATRKSLIRTMRHGRGNQARIGGARLSERNRWRQAWPPGGITGFLAGRASRTDHDAKLRQWPPSWRRAAERVSTPPPGAGRSADARSPAAYPLPGDHEPPFAALRTRLTIDQVQYGKDYWVDAVCRIRVIDSAGLVSFARGSYRPGAADRALMLLRRLPRWHHPHHGVRCERPIHAAGTTWLGHPRRLNGPGQRPPGEIRSHHSHGDHPGRPTCLSPRLPRHADRAHRASARLASDVAASKRPRR
jgi:hypothetical protein